MKKEEKLLYQLTERIERYSQAEDCLSLSRLHEILFLRRYLHNTRPEPDVAKDNITYVTSNIYTDTL